LDLVLSGVDPVDLTLDHLAVLALLSLLSLLLLCGLLLAGADVRQNLVEGDGHFLPLLQLVEFSFLAVDPGLAVAAEGQLAAVLVLERELVLVGVDLFNFAAHLVSALTGFLGLSGLLARSLALLLGGLLAGLLVRLG